MDISYPMTINLSPRELLTNQQIREDPDLHVRIVTAFDEVGAKTEQFYCTTPEERHCDLEILRKLGLAPGDIRTARDLLVRLGESVCTPQTMEERKKAKTDSCAQIAAAEELVIRAHHLLCVICYIARDDNDVPLDEDNLYEIWVKMRENPDLPVKLIEGANGCMVCPPCHAYDPKRGKCVAPCHLRDQWKDLETFRRLGLQPGDTLPVYEIIKRVYQNISTLEGICGLSSPCENEWASCLGWDTRYPKGLSKGFFPAG